MNISTGEPSTLKTYRAIAALVFQKALPMIDARIEKYGEDEAVIQDERQMLYLFAEIEFGGAPEDPAVTFCEAEGLIGFGGAPLKDTDQGDSTK